MPFTSSITVGSGTRETSLLDLRQMIKAPLARADPRLTLVDANSHDILAQSAVCVTINSAVGIEAMMHGRPVVLCGQTDFHHGAVTVTSADAMDNAIAQAITTDWPHDAFLYWYFGLNCLNAGKETLVDDFLAKVAQTGFALAC